jgi:bacteriophage N4 adsorption protein B
LPLFEILRWIEFIHFELVLFAATWFLIGGFNQLAIDGIWFGHRLYRKLRYYRIAPPQNSAQIANAAHPGLLAVFVPTWQESNVIAAMLHRCRESWQNGTTRYQIYVGCYPNDAAGIQEVVSAIADDTRIKLVICDASGPTTKADCLNRLWRAMQADELVMGVKAKAIILHDAEDYVHADELLIFDRLIEKAQGVQLPVIPVEVPGSKWISGHYCDEFAVSHGRDLVVREAIGAALPFAGVGCAIDRVTLGRIALTNQNNPFDVNSLTEDYELGLHIGAQGGRTMLARIRDQSGNLIGTRACFPATFEAAVRQKARWVTGIALAGWDRMGWNAKPVEIWMRLHDRIAVFAAILLFIAYVCLVLTGVLVAAVLLTDFQMSPLSPVASMLLWANGFLMLWRLGIRAVFVNKSYGWRSGLCSIPRSVVSSAIAIIAARRAVANYIQFCMGRKLAWDKTEHGHFPSPLI